jgi:hypothetical protein
MLSKYDSKRPPVSAMDVGYESRSAVFFIRSAARPAVVRGALASVGASFEHVVKLNTFLTDIRGQIPIYRGVRDRYVNTAAPPASTTVEISRLAREGALIEVEAIAVLPPR